MTTDLDKAVERLRDVLAGRDRGLVRPARSDDLRAILDEYDRRGAALVEAEAEITRLLTAFDGLDLDPAP